MGQFIPENEARAPKTAALIRQIPDVYNAFFSVLEPHQHIDPHWGHYKGYVRLLLLLRICLKKSNAAEADTHTTTTTTTHSQYLFNLLRLCARFGVWSIMIASSDPTFPLFFSTMYM